MKNITVKDLLNDLQLYYIDMGCYDIGRGTNKDLVIFDDDEDGNGEKPFLYLKFYKTFARFHNGLQLKKSEKNHKFYFKDYKNIEQFTDDIGDFTRKYFKDFKLVRK